MLDLFRASPPLADHCHQAGWATKISGNIDQLYAQSAQVALDGIMSLYVQLHPCTPHLAFTTTDRSEKLTDANRSKQEKHMFNNS